MPVAGGGIESRMSAEVVCIDEIAEGIARLVVRDPSGGQLPSWAPGAHIDIVLENGMTRQYSLCGNPKDLSVYEIAVLREQDSRGGSAYIHEQLREGHKVDIRGPRNNFPIVAASGYIFIAGGIGITPILPMLDAVSESSDWRLVYGGRSRKSMAFREELDERYGDRVRILPADEVGLLDLDNELGKPIPGTVVYSCGPESLLQAVERRCESWAPGTLHIERFSPKEQEYRQSDTFEVVLARSGMTLTVPPDRTILDVLNDVGIEVDVSCEEGICGTCETAVIEGVPDHRDSVLTEDERAQNDTIFVCVSRSCSAKLRLDL